MHEIKEKSRPLSTYYLIKTFEKPGQIAASLMCIQKISIHKWYHVTPQELRRSMCAAINRNEWKTLGVRPICHKLFAMLFILKKRLRWRHVWWFINKNKYSFCEFSCLFLLYLYHFPMEDSSESFGDLYCSKKWLNINTYLDKICQRRLNVNRGGFRGGTPPPHPTPLPCKKKNGFVFLL